MNTTPTRTETQDDLDRLFSEFFKAQVRHPWPNAPVLATANSSAPPTEPSELVASRAADASQSDSAPARRDSSSRARFTLAASVALMLGTCWYMSDGFQPGARPATNPNPGGPGMLQKGGANDPAVLKEVEKIKATEGGPKIDMDKFE